MPPDGAAAVSPEAFARWLTPLLPPGTKALAAAVSGGADSMALALLAAEYASARGVRFIALTVDHRLRPEAAAEAGQVATWLGSYGIEHETLWPSHCIASGNLQAWARETRYRLMAGFCHGRGIPSLLLAHHCDDQAETVMLRIRRGSHVEGLAAMRPVTEREGIRLVRPLLACPKARLKATLAARGQPWIEDPSNALPHFERNRVRVILAALPDAEGVSRGLARAAEQLWPVADARKAAVEDWLDSHAATRNDTIEIDAAAFGALPPEMGLPVLSRLLRRAGHDPYPPRFSDLERLYAALAETAPVPTRRTLHGCLVERRRGRLHFSPEKAAESG